MHGTASFFKTLRSVSIYWEEVTSTIVVSHAIEVGPESVWYPQLRDELVARGHDVTLVRLPDPQAPDPQAWLDTLAAAVDAAPAPEDTVLVGHSLGGVNVLRLLQRHDAGSRGAFAGVVLVATMAHPVGYDALAGFFEPPLDLAAIRPTAQQFRVLIAADDPVLVPDPEEHLRLLVDGLGATATYTAGGGHFPTWSPDTAPALDRLPEAIRLVEDCLAPVRTTA